MGKPTLSMAMFKSYVSLPKGIHGDLSTNSTCGDHHPSFFWAKQAMMETTNQTGVKRKKWGDNSIRQKRAKIYRYSCCSRDQFG